MTTTIQYDVLLIVKCSLNNSNIIEKQQIPIWLSLVWPDWEPMIYHTPVEHANHYTTDLVSMCEPMIYHTPVEHANHYTTDLVSMCENQIGICCFSSKHTELTSMSKDWLAQNQDNVPEWRDMSTCGLLFQWASNKKLHLRMLVFTPV
jgi:hypothetical protein